MAIVLTGTQTATKDLSPGHTAAQLTTLMATPVEQLTVKTLLTLQAAVVRHPLGSNPGTLLGAIFL